MQTTYTHTSKFLGIRHCYPYWCFSWNFRSSIKLHQVISWFFLEYIVYKLTENYKLTEKELSTKPFKNTFCLIEVLHTFTVGTASHKRHLQAELPGEEREEGERLPRRGLTGACQHLLFSQGAPQLPAAHPQPAKHVASLRNRCSARASGCTSQPFIPAALTSAFPKTPALTWRAEQ